MLLNCGVDEDFFFLSLSFLFFKNFNFYFILLYNTVLVLPYIDMNQPQVYMSSQPWTPLPLRLSGSSPCTSPKHPVSCIEHRLAISFLHNSIHVSVPFSQIIPPSPSPTEFKSPFYRSVSLLLSHIQGHHYHLSKFHIYVLVYTVLVFFFLAYFTLCNRLQFPTSLELIQMYCHKWLSNIPLCICTTAFLSICLLMDI